MTNVILTYVIDASGGGKVPIQAETLLAYEQDTKNSYRSKSNWRRQ
ncbi:hypothetical protein [Nostoc sp. NMS8]|nr:hypothetical protein [Nostoc sp. NMS8]MBN3957344.1 hypothetical protein [Nostoc sp. NMS8]